MVRARVQPAPIAVRVHLPTVGGGDVVEVNVRDVICVHDAQSNTVEVGYNRVAVSLIGHEGGGGSIAALTSMAW